MLLYENFHIYVFPPIYDGSNIFLQHLQVTFAIHGVVQKIWTNNCIGGHSAPHSFLGVSCVLVWSIIFLDDGWEDDDRMNGRPGVPTSRRVTSSCGFGQRMKNTRPSHAQLNSCKNACSWNLYKSSARFFAEDCRLRSCSLEQADWCLRCLHRIMNIGKTFQYDATCSI